jgi:hypothetical protein
MRRKFISVTEVASFCRRHNFRFQDAAKTDSELKKRSAPVTAPAKVILEKTSDSTEGAVQSQMYGLGNMAA